MKKLILLLLILSFTLIINYNAGDRKKDMEIAQNIPTYDNPAPNEDGVRKDRWGNYREYKRPSNPYKSEGIYLGS